MLSVCHSPDAPRGMLNDIWETPDVLSGLLKRHVKTQEASLAPEANADATFAPPPRTRNVVIPSLLRPLPASHKFAGINALQAMAACTQGSGKRIRIIGSGTSWHAALVAEYLIESIARVPVEVQYASEFRYRPALIRPGDVLILVSSSGETTDSVASLRLVKEATNGKDILTIAVVNEEESTLARESDVALLTQSTSEVGVASTKVFSAAILSCVLMAVALGEECGTFKAEEQRTLLEAMEMLPKHVQEVLDRESGHLQQGNENGAPGDCALWDIACQNVLAGNFIFLGRGFNFPIALEGAMKCKEVAYIHAEGYPAAEMKHGPIALIDQFMPVVVIAPKADPTYDKIKSNIEETRARHGSVIAVTEIDNTELQEICEYVIHVPRTHEYLMPLLAVIPMQLLAYMMGILRGNEVDNPRGLVKTVSERTVSKEGAD